MYSYYSRDIENHGDKCFFYKTIKIIFTKPLTIILLLRMFGSSYPPLLTL